jgi:hypothetical protein
MVKQACWCLLLSHVGIVNCTAAPLQRHTIITIAIDGHLIIISLLQLSWQSIPPPLATISEAFFPISNVKQQQ